MRSFVSFTILLAACGVDDSTLSSSYTGDPAVSPADDLTEGAEDTAAPAPVITRCGSTTTPEQMAVIEASHKAALDAIEAQGPTIAPVFATVDVVVHMITNGNRGVESTQRINDQIAAFNDAYAPVGIGFSLQTINTVNNSSWFANCAGWQRDAMKSALHTGGRRTLNLYLCEPNDGTLGYSSFPWEYSGHPERDGVIIRHDTVPGGALRGFNEGDTAVHEVGHWLGLYHTFEGGCSNNGDLVADTAPERSPAYGCNRRRDTCNGGGLDPVTNFMDYSDDVCLESFSAGQISRMQRMSGLYR